MSGIGGRGVFADARAKLSWAAKRQEDMQSLFADFAKLGGGDERPYSIRFHAANRPAGLIVAKFGAEKPMPIEMSLLAADLVHNARVALDHVVARLKDHLGGHPGQGSFPICVTEDDWCERVLNAGNRSPLHGLPTSAVNFIYSEQPLHRDPPEHEPLVVLNRLDNVDKHRLLQHSFFYPGVSTGLEGDDRSPWWERAVAAFPNYAEYQERTERLIPVFVLEPEA